MAILFGKIFYKLQRSRGWYPGEIYPITSGEDIPEMPHFLLGDSQEMLEYDWILGKLNFYANLADDSSKILFQNKIMEIQTNKLKESWKVYNRSYFWYISFVTITTLGLGDVLPISPLV